jgi:hypothetical protein
VNIDCNFFFFLILAIGILTKIRDSGIEFNGSITTLWSVLKEMGFIWTKTSDNRKIIIEKHDLRLKRIQYVRKIRQLRQEERPIVFTDETYIHSSHTQTKDWVDSRNLSLQKPIGKGNRLIILHAGGEMGFIKS